MGNRRMGLGRMEALLEAVDRDLNLVNTTLTDCTITTSAVATFSGGLRNSNVVAQTGTAAEDLTSTASDLVWYAATAQAADITLPQSTANNAGMKIKIIAGADWAASDVKIGFANGGSTVLIGNLTVLTHDANSAAVGFKVTDSAKCLVANSTAVAKAGGAKGSTYEFTYLAANLVHVAGVGYITTGTVATTSAASSGTGI